MTANGSPIVVKVQGTLNLKIGNENLRSIFIVAKDLSQNLIIGVDILSPNNCIIDYSTNQLIVGNSNIPIQLRHW